MIECRVQCRGSVEYNILGVFLLQENDEESLECWSILPVVNLFALSRSFFKEGGVDVSVGYFLQMFSFLT